MVKNPPAMWETQVRSLVWEDLLEKGIATHSSILWWLRRLSVCLQCGRLGFHPWVGKIRWRRKWQSTPVLLPGESHEQRSLVGYSPWSRKELDTTERLNLLTYLWNIEESSRLLAWATRKMVLQFSEMKKMVNVADLSWRNIRSSV